MKKVLAVLLAAVMVFSLSACGSKTSTTDNKDKDNTTTESIQNVFEEPMQAPDEIARAIKYNETYGLGGA